MLKVETLREIPAVLIRPDGTVREDYTMAAGELAMASFANNWPTGADLYVLESAGWLGTVRAVGVPRDAFCPVS